MFRVSRRTDYAARVMLVLASSPAGARVPTEAIRAQTFVPLAFLKRIVATLRHADLLRTYAGANGGLTLARPSAKISLFDIHVAMEGPISISECVANPSCCPLSQPCPVRPRWAGLQATIIRELKRTTLATLAARRPRYDARRSLKSAAL
jgi:Rrf2 family protein